MYVCASFHGPRGGAQLARLAWQHLYLLDHTIGLTKDHLSMLLNVVHTFKFHLNLERNVLLWEEVLCCRLTMKCPPRGLRAHTQCPANGAVLEMVETLGSGVLLEGVGHWQAASSVAQSPLPVVTVLCGCADAMCPVTPFLCQPCVLTQ